MAEKFGYHIIAHLIQAHRIQTSADLFGMLSFLPPSYIRSFTAAILTSITIVKAKIPVKCLFTNSSWFNHAATATRSRKAGSAFHKLRQVAHTVTQHCAPWGYPMTLIVVDTYYRSIRHQGSPEFANTGLWSKHQM